MTDWDTIAQRSNGQYDAADYERACYRLITEQVIYRTDHAGASVYWLIRNNERHIKDALDLMGVDLLINRVHEYAVALPRHAGATPVTTDETLIALVMRRYYDEQMRHGAITDEGEVICDLEEFAELYRQMTRRELPAKGVFGAVMRSLRRWGIAREADESDTISGAVAIRPAIVDVLGETALTRLASLSDADAGEEASPSGSVSEFGDEEVRDEA